MTDRLTSDNCKTAARVAETALDSTGLDAEGKKRTQNPYDEIQWPNIPVLRDREQWAKNRELVKNLCTVAKVIEWWEEDGDLPKMPYKFDYQGLTIEFLPTWDSYRINGRYFILPNSFDELVKHLNCVKEYKSIKYPDPFDPMPEKD